jgi:hypothetical protein
VIDGQIYAVLVVYTKCLFYAFIAWCFDTDGLCCSCSLLYELFRYNINYLDLLSTFRGILQSSKPTTHINRLGRLSFGYEREIRYANYVSAHFGRSNLFAWLVYPIESNSLPHVSEICALKNPDMAMKWTFWSELSCSWLVWLTLRIWRQTTFSQIVGELLSDYTTSHPRR